MAIDFQTNNRFFRKNSIALGCESKKDEKDGCFEKGLRLMKIEKCKGTCAQNVFGLMAPALFDFVLDSRINPSFVAWRSEAEITQGVRSSTGVGRLAKERLHKVKNINRQDPIAQSHTCHGSINNIAFSNMLKHGPTMQGLQLMLESGWEFSVAHSNVRHKDMFYIEVKDVEFREVIEEGHIYRSAMFVLSRYTVKAPICLWIWKPMIDTYASYELSVEHASTEANKCDYEKRRYQAVTVLDNRKLGAFRNKKETTPVVQLHNRKLGALRNKKETAPIVHV
ncbi:hypothetical protein Tco_0103158 [Tanacetum coccineum]